jgi:hypothetical protein
MRRNRRPGPSRMEGESLGSTAHGNLYFAESFLARGRHRPNVPAVAFHRCREGSTEAAIQRFPFRRRPGIEASQHLLGKESGLEPRGGRPARANVRGGGAYRADQHQRQHRERDEGFEEREPRSSVST